MSVSDLYTRVRTHPVLGRLLKWRPVALVAALILVPVTASATGDAPTGSVVYGRVKAQDVRLTLPATSHPKGMAIFFHGQNGGVDNRMDDPWLQSLVAAGWVVASSDFHTDSWGNEASTEDTQNLISWAEDQTDDLPIRMWISGSMGGSVSLNALVHGDDPAPPCWYGVKPAVDLTKMDNVPGADRIIQEAYGGDVPYDRNPVNVIDKLPTQTHYRMVTSPEDTWVRESQNTAKLAAGLEARGAQVSVFVVHGTHDDPSHFDNQDLLSFAASCEDAAVSTTSGGTANAAAAAG